MRGEWLRKPKGATAVVFVHGLLSDGMDGWRHATGAYWPQLVADVPQLANVGIYVFTSETNAFSPNYRLGDVVDALKEHMRLDDVSDSKRLIFVCHSMGGIVVRKYVVERAIGRMRREAQAVAALQHPAICSLFDIGDHCGATFLAMERLGETLPSRVGPWR